MYLNNVGEPSQDNDGGGSPFYFVLRRIMMTSPVDTIVFIHNHIDKANT